MKLRKVTRGNIATVNGHLMKAMSRMMDMRYDDLSRRISLSLNGVVVSEYSGCTVNFPNDMGIVPRIDLDFDTMASSEDIYCRTLFVFVEGYKYYIGKNFIVIKAHGTTFKLVFNFRDYTEEDRKATLKMLFEKNFGEPISNVIERLEKLMPSVEYGGHEFSICNCADCVPTRTTE